MSYLTNDLGQSNEIIWFTVFRKEMCGDGVRFGVGINYSYIYIHFFNQHEIKRPT